MARTKAIAHARPVKQTAKRRFSKIAEARDTLAGFAHDMEVDVMTFGQFSIIDAVEAILEMTGPARVSMATWTAAAFDLSQIEGQLKRAAITDLRIIVDRSFCSRHPQFVKSMHEKFGDNAVRTTPIHAKFFVIRNEEWDVVIRTSMNLNFNPRLEYLQVVDDRELADFYEQVVNEVFAEEEPGTASQRKLPFLAGIEGVKPTSRVRMGKR